MQFLKILFWCLIAFIAAVFTFGNWKWVTIQLFGNLVAEVNLPFLLLVTFAIGFVPTLIYQRAMRWRLRLRLNNAERALADLRAAPIGTPLAESAATAPATIAPPGDA
ncbi:lipopolysaccharide assembly protein LapA domain-containing protein [uncultured Sphingomonas sp.]|uniref:lipopolysaccharide assembly protein LapA domain-containing protein n=1 Tax=uncultured Sphingomonas sp. TaxID=158754 RepID=UPI002609A157|nr:lipopolysaccharide assembly protein LapA domain-containing protein [uncultured Sphingomonas sp.]